MFPRTTSLVGIAHAVPLPRQQANPQQAGSQQASSQQRAEQGGEENAADLVQESHFLRGDGHRMQAANIALTLRFDDTVKKLESRGDHEARRVLLGLAKEVCFYVSAKMLSD